MTQIAIRLEPALLEQADQLAAQLSKQMAGLEPSRAAVLRMAIVRGLAELQSELDGKAKRKR